MDCSSEQQHVSQVTSWQTGPHCFLLTHKTQLEYSCLPWLHSPWTFDPGPLTLESLDPRHPRFIMDSLDTGHPRFIMDSLDTWQPGQPGQPGHWSAWLQPWPWTAWSSGSQTSTMKTPHSKTGQCYHKKIPKTKTLRIWFSIFKRNTILQSQPYEFGYFNPVECFTLVDIFKRQCIV